MDTFSELLSRYIKRAGISDSEVARAVGISRQTIFRWREGLTSRPNSREDIMAIARKLRLSADETNSLLMSAGFRPEESTTPPSILSGKTEPEPVRVEATLSQESSGFNTVKRLRAKITPLMAIITLVVLACIAGLIIVVTNWSEWFPETANGISYPNLPATGNQTASVQPAGPGEMLVLVAPLGGPASGPSLARQLADSLEREARGNRLSGFRAVTLSESTVDISKLDTLLSDYKARMVVYGENENGDLSVFIRPVPDLSLKPVVLDGTAITGEQVRTLSLLVLASLSLNQDDPEQALLFLSAAHPLLPDIGDQNDPFVRLFNLLSEQARR